MREFPQLIGNGIEALTNWVRRATEMRLEDVGDFYALSNKADGYLSFEATTVSTNAGKRRVVLADATGGNLTVTIPPPDEITGKFIYVKKIDGGANTVTISVSGGATIDNSASYVMGSGYQSATIFSDGSEYWII